MQTVWSEAEAQVIITIISKAHNYMLYINKTILSYVYATSENIFPNDLNAKGLQPDIYQFSIDRSKLNVTPGEVFALRLVFE